MTRPLEKLPYAKLLELGERPCAKLLALGGRCQDVRSSWPEASWCLACQARVEQERKKIPWEQKS